MAAVRAVEAQREAIRLDKAAPHRRETRVAVDRLPPLEMDKGDQVVFSGKFFRGSDTALKGTNITDTFYGFDPKFLFKFSAVKADEPGQETNHPNPEPTRSRDP